MDGIQARNRVRAGFAAALFLVGATGVVAFRSTDKLIRTQRQVVHAHMVREQIQAVRAVLADGGGARRSYHITQQRRYLELYRESVKAIPTRIDALQAMTRGNPRQQADIERLRGEVGWMLRLWEGAVALQQRLGRTLTAREMDLENGNILRDVIRERLRRIDAEETHALERYRREAETTALRMKYVLVFAGALALALFLTAIYRSERDSRRAQEAERQLTEANARLTTLVTQDGLTGLKNHRALHERLGDEFARARRYDAPLSLVTLDVDRFKAYNDTFGHPAGDDVLREIAEILRRQARGSDTVARPGGEEFAILAPETDAGAALRLGERVRAAIEAHPWQMRHVTVSVGTSTLTPAMSAPSELIAGADKALYAAKRAGRNVVRQAAPPAAEPDAAEPRP